MQENSTASDNYLDRILSNIRYAKELSTRNRSARMVILVSGNETDREEWDKRLVTASSALFNNDGSTRIFSFLEKSGSKTREGNFLGTLLAYRTLREIAGRNGLSYRECVCLVGMLFGRGERISPYTQIEGGRKPAIRVGFIESGNGRKKFEMTAIEEALFYFTPVVSYLEARGFRGFLDKWGDETEIASVDLSIPPADNEELRDADVIKFVSDMEITEELAPQKDWVISDGKGRVTAMISRNEKRAIEKKLSAMGNAASANGRRIGGVSLGPVAVSYDFLEAALAVFEEEIDKEGVFFDFDPYFLMRLAFKGSKAEWEKTLEHEDGYGKLQGMIPDFFEKTDELRKRFKKMHGRDIVYKSFDMGDKVYWADIGQHVSMRKKYMLVNRDDETGIIARSIEGISDKRDSNGNIVIGSTIGPGAIVRDSVIIDSVIKGDGSITGSVICNSVLDSPRITNAFAVLSERPIGPVELADNSGLYRSVGTSPVRLGRGMRHGTLILKDEALDMFVSEDTDLKDTKRNYDTPVFDNPLSFRDAYDTMFGVSGSELEKRRESYIASMYERLDSTEETT